MKCDFSYKLVPISWKEDSIVEVVSMTMVRINIAAAIRTEVAVAVGTQRLQH
jgi:hypothetical protein